MQVLEPPVNPQTKIYYDEKEKGYFAEGFLLSTKRSLPTKTNLKGIKINKDIGHKIAASFQDKYFMIDPKLLARGVDSHYYGIGKDALIEGYKKRGYGQIKSMPGPFSYPDGSGDYWYSFRMRLHDGAAAQALIDLGKKFTDNFNVSPHIWDEKVGPDKEILEGEGLGVALVKRGAWGDQAILSQMCKGDEFSCFGPKGIAGAALAECQAGCNCAICKNEEIEIVKIISSLVGQSGSESTEISKMADQTTGSPGSTNQDPGKNDAAKDAGKDAPLNQNNDQQSKQNPTTSPQDHVTDAPKIQGQVIIDAAKLEELEKAAASVTEINNERKNEILNKMFEIVPEDKERNSLVKEYSKFELGDVKEFKSLADKLIPFLTEKIKADLQNAKESESEDDKKGNKKVKGQAGSSLPAEKPKEKTDATSKDKEGQAGSTKRFTGKPTLRQMLNGRFV